MFHSTHANVSFLPFSFTWRFVFFPLFSPVSFIYECSGSFPIVSVLGAKHGNVKRGQKNDTKLKATVVNANHRLVSSEDIPSTVQ